MDLYRDTILRPLFERAVKHGAAHLVDVQLAHIRMLTECGLLDPEQLKALWDGSLQVDRELASSPPAYNPIHEDLYFWFETKLGERVGADLAGRAHLARSRNDLDHTIFRMELRSRLRATRGHLLDLIETVLTRAAEQAGELIVAYTHGQPAQPTSLAHYLHALVEVFLRRADDLERSTQIVDMCPMGAAAITTTGFETSRRRVAELLGFAGLAPNSYAAIAGADYLTHPYASLQLLSIDLGRWVHDLNFQTSFEVRTLRLDAQFVQISSIMPQKQNPVVLEHLRHMLAGARGAASAVVSTLQNTPFADINDSEAATHARGHSALDEVDRALVLLREISRGMQVDRERVSDILARSFCSITELADTLVRREDLSFRVAHEVASHTAKEMIARDLSIYTVPDGFISDTFQRLVGRACNTPDEVLRKSLEPANFVDVRNRPGGPGRRALAEAQAEYDTTATRLRDALDNENQRTQKALGELREFKP